MPYTNQSIVTGHGNFCGLAIFCQLDQHHDAADWKVGVLLLLTRFLEDLAGEQFNGFQMPQQPVLFLWSQLRQKLVFVGVSRLKTCHPCPWLGCSDTLTDFAPL